MPLSGQPTGTTIFASGSVTGPGAGATIATIASGNLPAGIYLIDIQVWYGAVAGAENDMALQVSGSNIFTFQIDAAAASNIPVRLDAVRKLSGANDLTVVAVAGAAGTYKCSIAATKIRGL